MNELQAVLDGLDHLWQLGEAAALATVVSVSGSAYRRPGARMLVAPGGQRLVGSVSGGCLEGDVARKAWQLTDRGGAALLRYDSTAEDDGLWGLGLGCQGAVEILVERVTAEDKSIRFLRHCLVHREAGLIATVFRADPQTGLRAGGRLLLHQDQAIAADAASLAHQLPDLVEDAHRAMSERCTSVANYDLPRGQVHVLLEIVEPPPALLIFGAGWDALPLLAAAKALGWPVTVIDRRAAHANRNRFALADELIVCPPDDVSARIKTDARSAAVVMSHHYPDDLEYVHAALQSEAFYVGLLGPARRKDRLLADLQAEENFSPSPEQLDRLHAPIGLDIGADNPVEIAASIVAEIMAVQRGRRGGPLRDRDAPIHDPLKVTGSRALEEAACPGASV